MKIVDFPGNKNKSNFTFRFDNFMIKLNSLTNSKQIQSKESFNSPETSGNRKFNIQETQR